MSKSYFCPLYNVAFSIAIFVQVWRQRRGEGKGGGGISQLLISADRGVGGVQKGPQYADVILEELHIWNVQLQI